MVRGLEIFKKHFADFSDQYALIGGTACALLMEEVGLEFRATKDLDIVLYVEVLHEKFVKAFWDFIALGGYQNRQRSTGKDIFYRFHSPSEPNFPAMIELFSRTPNTIKLSNDAHLTPIPISDQVDSLSAILLDEDYYQLIQSGKSELSGLSVVNAGHLIPLKVRAWIDLSQRKSSGLPIDEKDIRKHKNDILRLYQLLLPNQQVALSEKIKKDLQEFLIYLKNDSLFDMKNLGLKNIMPEELIANLTKVYQLNKIEVW